MLIPNSYNDADAKMRLYGFVQDAFKFIENLIVDEKLYFKLFGKQPKELYASFRKAWEELSNSFTLADARQHIQEAKAEFLVKAGLFGAQLDLKLSVLKYRMQQWGKALSKPVSTIAYKVLEAIDTVLDSLVQALGIGEALKEVKDVLMGICE